MIDMEIVIRAEPLAVSSREAQSKDLRVARSADTFSIFLANSIQSYVVLHVDTP